MRLGRTRRAREDVQHLDGVVVHIVGMNVPDAADVCVWLPVPIERIGAVVGRGGDGLRSITHRTGCRITVDAKPGGGARLAYAGRTHAVATLVGPRANVLMGLAQVMGMLGV